MAQKKEIADYKHILKAVLGLLDDDVAVEEVVSDFEKAVCRSLSDLLPNVKLLGYSFYWTQVVYRNLKSKGLVPKYMSDRPNQVLYRRVMCLHLLPASKIEKKTFQKPQVILNQSSRRWYTKQIQFHILDKAKKFEDHQLDKFFDYVKNTWMNSNIWPPRTWSVFLQPVRTNNDAEGWHYRVNVKGKGAGFHFCKLIDQLHQESEFVEVEEAFLKQNTATRRTRLDQEIIQAELYHLCMI